MEWYHVCWPRLTAKRVEPVVSISWASCLISHTRKLHNMEFSCMWLIQKYKSCALPRRYYRRKIKPPPLYYRNVCLYYCGVTAVTAVFPPSQLPCSSLNCRHIVAAPLQAAQLVLTMGTHIARLLIDAQFCLRVKQAEPECLLSNCAQ